jgi:hypothetical protein
LIDYYLSVWNTSIPALKKFKEALEEQLDYARKQEGEALMRTILQVLQLLDKCIEDVHPHARQRLSKHLYPMGNEYFQRSILSSSKHAACNSLERVLNRLNSHIDELSISVHKREVDVADIRQKFGVDLSWHFRKRDIVHVEYGKGETLRVYSGSNGPFADGRTIFIFKITRRSHLVLAYTITKGNA